MKPLDILSFKSLSTLGKLIAISVVALIVAACGGSSGGSSGGGTLTGGSGSSSGGSSSVDRINYAGPAPSSETVQQYRTEIWNNVALSSRCGGCHIDNGAGPIAFARTDDINLAYAAAISSNLIDTANPANSRLVTKVGEGHNCSWQTNVSSCVDDMTNWVAAFAGGPSDTSFLGALGLVEPTSLRDPGDSKQFPALADDGSATDFESTIYSLTSQYCVACHSENTALQQQPFIASQDVQVAYEAARSRINLEDGSVTSVGDALSRLIVRLRDEGHNCWGGSCATSANQMLTQIQAFSNALTPVAVDPSLVFSRAFSWNEGQSASSGPGRVETNLIAKWEFKDGITNPSTRTADDRSGVTPLMPLTIFGNTEWLSSGGIRINSGKLQANTSTSGKLYDRITASGEYTVEAWVVPLNVTQDGPARIVSYSGATDSRNFTLGQTQYDYDFLARSSETDGNGQPVLSTPSADEVLQATLQHVVATYSATEGRSIYVNGELVTAADPEGAGNFNSWDRNFALVVGNEVSNDNQWQGTVRFLAIYDGVMSEADIQTNFDIGVGETFYLLFSIANHISIPSSYIVMQVEQFDNYGYLFSEPFFVTFDANATIADVPIEGIRIGINGQEAAVGQAFANIDTTITQAAVTAGEGRQVLSTIGTVIGVDQGSDSDEFFLTFERLGSEENVFVEATPTAAPRIASTDEQSDIGIKTFDEINEALAALTGISKTNADVVVTFESVKQQLPVDESIDGFASAQQMAVTQLAVKYCDVLVDQEAALDASGNNTGGYFPGFDFGATPTAAFDTTGRDQIIAPLLDSLLANTVSSNDQPSFLVAEAELDDLITNLMGSCNADSCSQNNDRVGDIAIAACAAAFGSGMMTIQ